jgi:hypothetical protein
MVNKAQTGMQGVFLVAAELTARGFIVSVTSRNAFGADLLVTSQGCEITWSVQVKTNRVTPTFWLLNSHAQQMKYPNHIYVFVNLKGAEQHEYYIVRSEFVADHVCVQKIKGGTWYSFSRNDAKPYLDGWNEVFRNPGPPLEPQSDTNK